MMEPGRGSGVRTGHLAESLGGKLNSRLIGLAAGPVGLLLVTATGSGVAESALAVSMAAGSNLVLSPRALSAPSGTPESKLRPFSPESRAVSARRESCRTTAGVVLGIRIGRGYQSFGSVSQSCFSSP